MRYFLGIFLLFLTTLLSANNEVRITNAVQEQETAKTIAFEKELKSKKSRQEILREEVRKLREIMLREQNQS